MRRAILAFLGIFRKRPREDDHERVRAGAEAEREATEAKRDMMIEAQRRDDIRI